MSTNQNADGNVTMSLVEYDALKQRAETAERQRDLAVAERDALRRNQFSNWDRGVWAAFGALVMMLLIASMALATRDNPTYAQLQDQLRGCNSENARINAENIGLHTANNSLQTALNSADASRAALATELANKTSLENEMWNELGNWADHARIQSTFAQTSAYSTTTGLMSGINEMRATSERQDDRANQTTIRLAEIAADAMSNSLPNSAHTTNATSIIIPVRHIDEFDQGAWQLLGVFEIKILSLPTATSSGVFEYQTAYGPAYLRWNNPRALTFGGNAPNVSQTYRVSDVMIDYGKVNQLLLDLP